MEEDGISKRVTATEHLHATERDTSGIPSVGIPHLLARGIDGTLKVVIGMALFVELAIVFSSTVSRSFFGKPFLWTDEAARLALSTLAFLGGAFAYRRGEHAFLQSVVAVLPLGVRRVCYTLVEFLVLVVAVTTGLSAVPLLITQSHQLTPMLHMRAMWFAVPLVASMLVLALTAVQRLLAQHRPTVMAVGAAFSAVIFFLVLTQNALRLWLAGGDTALSVSLGVFFATLLIGLPVGFALLLGAVLYLYASGMGAMVALPHTMVNGVASFVLLAFPFFIFAGIIMNKGGISLRLVRLVKALVGHFRGGLFQVMVVSMYIVSGLSGSKAADVAAVGSVMRDMLRREGYNMEEATAVLAASAAMGETIPPSLGILVLGSITTLSIGALFLAGLIPAAVVAVCLMTLIYIKARRLKTGHSPRVSLGELVRASLGGLLPLFMPAVLIGGIVFGIGTPTEVSSFAVVYGLVLASLVYRELGFQTFLQGLIDCASASGMILFILGAAWCFAWTLTTADLPQRLVGILAGAHQSRTLFMLASMALLIVAGSILEGLPALVVLAPILMPIASEVGVNLLHYGIVLLIAMGIGAFMPPTGIGFYVTCAVCETSIEKSARTMIPYFVVLCIGLLLVGAVPWFTLFLPVKFHFGQ